jgi:hypothetical protein
VCRSNVVPHVVHLVTMQVCEMNGCMLQMKATSYVCIKGEIMCVHVCRRTAKGPRVAYLSQPTEVHVAYQSHLDHDSITQPACLAHVACHPTVLIERAGIAAQQSV